MSPNVGFTDVGKVELELTVLLPTVQPGESMKVHFKTLIMLRNTSNLLYNLAH